MRSELAPISALFGHGDTILDGPNTSDGLEKAVDRALVGDWYAVSSPKDSLYSLHRSGTIDWALVNVPREQLDEASLDRSVSMSRVMNDVCFG
jgi:hypothetical protein